MALTDKQISTLRHELETAARPLFFFDDDPDGLTAFLLLYRLNKEGNGVMVKKVPCLDISFLRKVDEYSPDKIFVLDVPTIEQEFINKAKVPMFWIDHHKPQKNTNIFYCNPRVNDDNDNRPTNYWAYQVAKQDTWIALVGCVADWHLPEFKNQFPDLIPEEVNDIQVALFTTKAGKLARIFSFILKGKTADVNKAIKVLTRIKDYKEILEQTTAQGKFIYKKYEQINKEYELLIEGIGDHNVEGNILFYRYNEQKHSFTSDLSNELQYKFKDKVIMIARVSHSEAKCSLRAQFLELDKVVEKALVGIDGYGGGHKHACGACIKEHDFERFKKNLREIIDEALKKK